MPFTLREFADPRQARMGVVECIKHELLHAYPVLWERDGECVSHFKFTVLLLPSGTHRITGVDALDGNCFKSSKVCSPIEFVLWFISSLNSHRQRAFHTSSGAAGGNQDTSCNFCVQEAKEEEEEEEEK